MGKAVKRTFVASENNKEIERRTSTQPFTHAVLCERSAKNSDGKPDPDAGKTTVIRWSASEEAAGRAVKEFSGKSWAGAWLNCRVVTVKCVD